MTRPLCTECGVNVAKQNRRAKGPPTYRAFCSSCYERGVAKVDIVIVARPRRDTLADTGLRIDDRANTLLYPDGTRQTPVPRNLVFECWIEEITPEDHPRPLLRVLRPAAQQELRHG